MKFVKQYLYEMIRPTVNSSVDKKKLLEIGEYLASSLYTVSQW